MASLWRKAMVYLGLQDDDEYGYDPYESEYPQYDVEEPEYQGHGGEPRNHHEPRSAGDSRAYREPSELRESYGEPTVRALHRDEPPSGVTVSRPAVVRTVATMSAKVHVVEPRGFNDAQEVGDRIKANQPVILNLQGLSRDLQRRLIDFSSGLAYAVNGSMARVADQVFLLTPSNVEVSQEEKERLQARGLYRS